MVKRPYVLASLLALLLVGSALALQANPQNPVMDKAAEKVITKYQSSSCAQLTSGKSEKPTDEEAAMKEKVLKLLKNNDQMRKAFIDKVAARIANKMFECGMIP